MSCAIAAALVAGEAGAAEVLWLAPGSAADRARVAAAAGASSEAVDAAEVRTAATAWTEADEEAYANLERALAEARTYETRLDGELVIMRDLDGPVAAVGAVRDEADRGRLFAALAYQGFAVDRFFGDDLAAAAEAEPYRALLNDVAVERPWRDAVALDPERAVTAYEIAEAPQRVAYGAVQTLVTDALPASITPRGLPEGGQLVVDGRPAAVGPSGNVKLPPGRHLLHVLLSDRIAARWDVTLASGASAEVQVPLDDATWTSFVSELAPGGSVPEPVAACVRAIGGALWVVSPGDDGLRVLEVTPGGVEAVALEDPPPTDIVRSSSDGVVFGAGLLGGWLSSGDFYTQDPGAVPRERGTVNATTLGLYLDIDGEVGPLVFGGGVDALLPLGADHIALTGEGSTRLRAYPHLEVGVRYAVATVGYLLPYHPGAGAELRLPLGPAEVRLHGLVGLPRQGTRSDDTTYDYLPVYAVLGGAGVRL